MIYVPSGAPAASYVTACWDNNERPSVDLIESDPTSVTEHFMRRHRRPVGGAAWMRRSRSWTYECVRDVPPAAGGQGAAPTLLTVTTRTHVYFCQPSVSPPRFCNIHPSIRRLRRPPAPRKKPMGILYIELCAEGCGTVAS